MLDEAQARDAIIVALDCGKDEALALSKQLQGVVGWLKVGMTLFYAEGPRVLQEFKDLGFNIFLDLKLHDIPFQIEGAAKSAALSGADIISAHALGGEEMLASAKRGVAAAAAEAGASPAKIVAISVLTSMNQEMLASIGVSKRVDDEVELLSRLAARAGADGMVCSPNEAGELRSLLGSEALIVCPGIRPAGSEAADQMRIATPSAAIEAGASKLVIGRPITHGDSPRRAAENIVAELIGN